MSLSLTLYLANARRHGARLLRQSQSPSPQPERPQGTVVWIHLENAKDIHKIQSLTKKLIEERGDVSFVITANTNAFDKYQGTAIGHSVFQGPPVDTPQHAQLFLTHWSPDVALWLTSKLRPALIVETAGKGVPMIMAGIESFATLHVKKRGNASIIKALLPHFCQIMTTGKTVKRHLIQQGANPDDTSIVGKLGFDTSIPACEDSKRDQIAVHLAARPVWMAYKTIYSELESIIAAHRSAARLAHRLLLVITPDDPLLGREFAQRLFDMGWNVGLRSKGDLPQEDTQILIADHPEEIGLWMRISPVCFLGNTLTDNAYGAAPFEALALGASVLHGPKTGEFSEAFTQIDSVGAARLVKDPDSLSGVVTELLAPDKAAKMAHAGWALSSKSAETSDHIVGLLHDLLDKAG